MADGVRRVIDRAVLESTQLSLRAVTEVLRRAASLASSIGDGPSEQLPGRPDGEIHELDRPDGTVVRVHVAGDPDGPVAVLTHGYGLTSSSWNGVSERLVEEGARVVTLDWRGHGNVGDGDGKVMTDELVGDLRAVLEDLDLSEVLIVAHSTGGYVTMAMLIEHPEVAERLRGLVLVSTLAGSLLDGAQQEELDLLRATFPARLLRNRSLRFLLAGFAQGIELSSAISAELLEEFSQADHAILATLLHELADRSYYGRLHEIALPCVVLCGSEDRTTPSAHASAIADEIPGARLITVDGASHLLNWQRPERIADLVTGFDAATVADDELEPDRSALVILNPASGDHEADDTQHAITLTLGEAGVDVEVRRTEGEGDAAQWAEEVANGGDVDLVLAVGGDGTVREVLAGVAKAGGGVTVGIVPTGTANLLARALAIPIDDSQAATQVAAGPGVRDLDLMHLVDRDEYAALMVDAGFDARLVRDASRELKNVLGSLAYVVSGLRHTIGLRDRELQIELDGEARTVTGHSVLCLNVGRIGQTVVVDEEIEPDDGRLHVGIVKRSSPWQVLLTAAGMVALGRDAHPNVEWLRGTRLRVDGDDALQLQVDGDPAGETPVEVELLPAAVEVSVPTGSS